MPSVEGMTQESADEHNTHGSVPRDTDRPVDGDALRNTEADTASGGAPDEPDSHLGRDLADDASGESQQ